MTQLNYKVSKPVISEKPFVKNSHGNYVLSYSVSPAKIQNSRDSLMMKSSEYMKFYEQNAKSRMIGIQNKSEMLQLMNSSKPCN